MWNVRTMSFLHDLKKKKQKTNSLYWSYMSASNLQINTIKSNIKKGKSINKLEHSLPLFIGIIIYIQFDKIE